MHDRSRARDDQPESGRQSALHPLADLALPSAAKVLEIGCGPGPVARTIAARGGVAAGVLFGVSDIALKYLTGALRAETLAWLHCRPT